MSHDNAPTEIERGGGFSAHEKAADLALFLPTWMKEAQAFVATRDPHDARRLANATRHLMEEGARLLARIEYETDIPDIH